VHLSPVKQGWGAKLQGLAVHPGKIFNFNSQFQRPGRTVGKTDHAMMGHETGASLLQGLLDVTG
jgi:hypothetical protein